MEIMTVYPGVLHVIADTLKSKRGMQNHQRDAKKEQGRRDIDRRGDQKFSKHKRGVK